MDFNLHASASPVVSPAAYVWASPSPTRLTEMEQRRLEKMEDDEEETGLENALENLTISNSNSEKYRRDYDDSSSEEDMDEIENSGLEQLGFGVYESIEDIAPFLGERVTPLDLQLSFLLHEFGVRLLSLTEVEQEYRRLKLEALQRTNVPSDQQIENCIRESIQNAFLKTYNNNRPLLERFLHSNEAKINEIITRALDNKRSFIKAVNKRSIEPILPNHKTYFNTLPLNGRSEISLEDFYTYVYGVYREIGEDLQVELETSSILYSKAIKKKLRAYIHVCLCPIKATIANLLLEVTARMHIQTFVTRNRVALNDARPKESDSFIHNFQTELIAFLSKQRIERGTLPDSYTIVLNGNYTPAQFLAWLRVMNISARREFKNSLNFPSIFGATQKTLSRRLGFPGVGGKEMVLETQIIHKETGTRLDKVQDSNKYKHIYARIQKIKDQFLRNRIRISDSKIADWIKATLKGQLSDVILGFQLEEHQKSELRTVLNAMTYLLFGTEAVRNPASLLTHAMMLELIQEGGLTWEEALKGKMSMSIEGAVSASRWVHLYQYTSLSYAYDRTTTSISENMDTNAKLINLEAEIFSKWLKLRNIDVNDLELIDEIIDRDADLLQIIKRIDYLTLRWYGISILSKGLIKDKIKTKSRRIANQLDLYFLSRDDVLNVRQMLKDGLKERIINLLIKRVSLQEMLEVYEESAGDFRNLTEPEVMDGLFEGRYQWEELRDCYYTNYQEFEKHVYGEESEEDEESQEDGDQEDSEESTGSEDSYFCPSILYDNPLLNDPDFLQLAFLAKKHFGNRGVNKLIDMGAAPEKYKAFLNTRTTVGNEEAIKLSLTQELEEELTDALVAKADLEMRRMRNEDLTDVGIQKLNAQLRYYQETGHLFEAARRALNEESPVPTEPISPPPLLNSNPNSFDDSENKTYESNTTSSLPSGRIPLSELKLSSNLLTEELSLF